MITPTVSNYEALLALSTSPHMTDVMREYLTAVLGEHREMREALKALFEHCAMMHKHWGEGCNQKQADAAIAAGRAILAKVSA